MESEMEFLQCHFNWDLETSRSRLLNLRDKLEDIGTETGNRWLGHIYNLWGFIQFKLEEYEDAKRLFNKAAEAFSELRHADEGPWLVVNYGNLAWLHHHLREHAESQDYLSKVDALMEKYPSPSQSELHPEIYAEKAWTLMNFGEDKNLVTFYFQEAIRMQPDMVEWNTSHVLNLVDKHSPTGVDTDLLEKMRAAKEQDPENLYLVGIYLEQLAKKGENFEYEAVQLAKKVSMNPVSSYSGLRVVLRFYRNHVSADEAIGFAERALNKHPEERYLKRCVAVCYKWKIIYSGESCPQQSTWDRAISLHEELLSLYPHSNLMKKIDLASICAKTSDSKEKAEQIYQELLLSDLDAADKQMLYNHYAYHLYYDQQNSRGSIQYHMKAAEIAHQSFYRDSSINCLRRIKDRNRHTMCPEIGEFLRSLSEAVS
ncbi:interferon-induced protein with tetratricopeptide repeats 1-like [Xyrichtys novacula]|uniref:Interferon-induced protein with tetratricopeptide repeats 1-like n=1 Tax=Xyrichtys novacula TaxID=13765 RepID=A0AAV1FFL9_XYRNO|nr:interferon-induced protein with tetratricopeptide repeats 1-like [Xyrichtys novacula]